VKDLLDKHFGAVDACGIVVMAVESGF